MTTIFGQIVIGPPGSGKTTYCKGISEFMTTIGRNVTIVNIDPANDYVVNDINLSELITLEDVMEHLKLGPNGSLIYCMEFLEKHLDWLLTKIGNYQGNYFLFDCPGQVELYTHNSAIRNIVKKLEIFGFRLCAVNLIDVHYCNEPFKFISAVTLSLSTMIHIELPHINVLSKVDLAKKYGQLRFGLDFYTEVLDLEYLLASNTADLSDPFARKYQKLNASLISLIENYGLVTFLPLDIQDKDRVYCVVKAIDKANGYVFGMGEERNILKLLSCAVGAESETDRIGSARDQYSF